MAAEVARDWLEWVATRLHPAADARAAAGVLTMLDGLLLVGFVASDEVAAQAVSWLAEQLD